MNAEEHAIVAHNLTKVYRSRWSGREVRAVDNLSLQVRRASTFGLLGPNGAGKTTFVKMLLSAVHPTKGSAFINSRNAAEPRARQPIGYLPENHRFPTYFTGEGMLDFYAALSGMDSTSRRKRIPELLALVGLDNWGHVRLGKYSKGMLQRVGLAQAIIHNPEILILDEPTDGVDPVGRRHIRDILTRLEEKGTTIFINSHLLAEVELFCEEVAILNKGKLVLQGKVRDLTAGKGYRLTTAGGETHHYATREDLNAAIDQFRRDGVDIESVTPTTSSLEDVFVSAVSPQTAGAAAE